MSQQSQRIHGTGIFTYIYQKNQPNVAKYTIPMDPMGINLKAERSWEILDKSVYTVGRHETADFQLQGESHGPSGALAMLMCEFQDEPW